MVQKEDGSLGPSEERKVGRDQCYKGKYAADLEANRGSTTKPSQSHLGVEHRAEDNQAPRGSCHCDNDEQDKDEDNGDDCIDLKYYREQSFSSGYLHHGTSDLHHPAAAGGPSVEQPSFRPSFLRPRMSALSILSNFSSHSHEHRVTDVEMTVSISSSAGLGLGNSDNPQQGSKGRVASTVEPGADAAGMGAPHSPRRGQAQQQHLKRKSGVSTVNNCTRLTRGGVPVRHGFTVTTTTTMSSATAPTPQNSEAVCSSNTSLAGAGVVAVDAAASSLQAPESVCFSPK